jgi:hypothetical protein
MQTPAHYTMGEGTLGDGPYGCGVVAPSSFDRTLALKRIELDTILGRKCIVWNCASFCAP